MDNLNDSIPTGILAGLRFSGRVHPHDVRHQLIDSAAAASPVMIPPNCVPIPGSTACVPQYAPPVRGTSTAYDPPNDCSGYFMSAKYQPNNNCYAYGTVIAANSFPQPGRAHGYLLPSGFTGADVVHGATMDGLVDFGSDLATAMSRASGQPGHLVALLISPASGPHWPGDYHWVRCDSLSTGLWSQKDGGDQVTNFDFAGAPITDPGTANWTVNQGPTGSAGDDLVVAYTLFTYMFVPNSGVDIL